LNVDFVPPPKPDQSPAGNVLDVVEVYRQEDDGEDEDEDAAGDMLARHRCERLGTDKLLVKRTPRM
jgi:hypothetical protein